VRKLALTVHVVSSVGWLGAVAASLALATAGLAGEDAQVVRAAYLAMNSIGEGVLVPLALTSLLSGVVQALGTKWGLFRHYWVLMKFLINVFASAVLVLYMQTLGYLAGLAADPSVDLSVLRNPSPMLHAGAAMLLLVVATTLSVYKPRGMTRYGWRKQQEERRRKQHIGDPNLRYTGGL
jgi:hypothetical protein